jgi:hypothetical protein
VGVVKSHHTAICQPQRDKAHQDLHSRAAGQGRRCARVRVGSKWPIAVVLQERHRVGRGGGLGSRGGTSGRAIPDTNSEGKRATVEQCTSSPHHARSGSQKHCLGCLGQAATTAKRTIRVSSANVLQERFLDRLEDYAAARGKYIIDKQLLGTLKRDTVIMHPLPRVDEVCCSSCRMLVCWQLL